MPQSNIAEFTTEDVEFASFLITVGEGKFRGVRVVKPGQAEFLFRPKPSEDANAKFLRDEPVGARTLFGVRRSLINQLRGVKANGN